MSECDSPIHMHIRLSLELSYYYWCWCSVLGDLAILADWLSISLGIGLSVTFKTRVRLLRWLWGTVAQWLEHLQLKQMIAYFLICLSRHKLSGDQDKYLDRNDDIGPASVSESPKRLSPAKN